MTRAAAKTWYIDRLTAAAETSPQHHHEAQRWLARNDLYYLLVAVLGRKDANKDWIFERCREVQASPDGHLDLWAREHYKSTVITLGLTLQDILNDPEITIGIFSHTRPIAKAFLIQIKRELEQNRDLIGLFPDILWDDPRREAPKWSEDQGLIVKRKGNPKESTIEAWGLVDGQPVSKHFDVLMYDDMVTMESVSNPEMIRKVTRAWELSLSLGVEGGAQRYAGTRYHFNDPYGEIIRRGAALPRIHAATRDGDMASEPVLMSSEELAERRRKQGPYTFGCQMLLDPKADKVQGFDRNWLRYWPARHIDGLNLYILVDPASKKKKDSDYSVFTVVGIGADGKYRVVTWIRDRLNLKERGDTLFALHRDYRPLGVGYEEYGLQSDIEYMQDRMERENYDFTITPLGGRIAKPDRIKRLIPRFEQEEILIPETCWRENYEGTNEDLTKVFVDEEYDAFPVPHHDDMLDCLARIEDADMKMVAPGGKKAEARLGPRPTHTNSGMKFQRRGRR